VPAASRGRDLLLGTFRNPKAFDGECGFEAPNDRKVGAMLALRDVNAPLYGAGSLGVPRVEAARAGPIPQR
jgi:hypothetical protein